MVFQNLAFLKDICFFGNMNHMFLLGCQEAHHHVWGLCFFLQAAQHSQKQSTELFQCMYFKDKDPETEERCISDGVIYSIRTNGVLVFIPRYVISNTKVMRSQLTSIQTHYRNGGFDPCVGKIPWRRERLPTPVFWPGEFHGLYSQYIRYHSLKHLLQQLY